MESAIELGGPPPVFAAGGVGEIESQSIPAAVAMSLACRMNDARSGVGGTAARSVRRVACCCAALLLSSLSRRISSWSCWRWLWACATWLRVSSRSVDVGANSTKYQSSTSTTPPAIRPTSSPRFTSRSA